MTHVAALYVAAAHPCSFFGTNFIHGAAHVVFELDLIKNEKLWLGSKVSGIANTGRFEVGLCTLRKRTWIALVTLKCGRLHDITSQINRRFFCERVNDCARVIGHQNHV